MPAVYEVYISNDSGEHSGPFLVYKSDRAENKVLSPHLQKGTNKASSFDFTVLPEHEHYDKFSKVSTYVRLDREGDTIFYGRVSDIKTDIFKQKEISCEGSLTFLKDSILAPNTFMDVTTEQSGKKSKSKRYKDGRTPEMTVEAFFRSLITTHNGLMSGTSDINSRKQFTVGTVSVNKRSEQETFEITSYSDISSAISSQLLSRYGGIIRTRYDNASAINYIDWIEDYTDNNNQAIEFGVNLIDIDKEKAGEELWTMLLPVGENGITIDSANPYLPVDPSSDALVQKYGKIIHYKKFEDAKNVDTLLTKAREYFNLHRKDYPDTLTIKAVDLHYLNSNGKQALDIGTLIQIKPNGHSGITGETRACIEMDLDIQNPENSTYTIGNIMPPDEQGKAGKTSLSSKHSSGSRSTGASFNAVSDRIDGLQSDIDINANNIDINAENISVNATNISVNADNIEANADQIDLNADQIRINGGKILINEGRIDAIDGNFTNLTSGTSKADYLKAINLFGDKTYAYELHVENKTGSITGFIQFSPRFIKLANNFTVNSGYILANADMNLAHSHSVSVNDVDGTVTLQGAVATDADNRSFRIADTQTYKAGVSAAEKAVYIKSIIIDPSKNVTYDSSTNTFTIPIKAMTSKDKVTTKDLDYDASYEVGRIKKSVTIKSLYKNGVSYYRASADKWYAPISALTSEGISATGEADVTDAFDSGVDYGEASAYDNVTLGSVACYSDPEIASNKLSQYIDLTVYIDKVSPSGQNIKSETYRLNCGLGDVYSTGYDDGKVNVLNNFTINDVYVYKGQNNQYRADVRLHYGNADYTRGNLSVRGI